MKIIKAGFEIIRPDTKDAIYERIERAGRTCYKSESAITPESAAEFVKKVVKNHHEAMLEHASMTVRFTVDRGVSHELVRHRMASFAQESTRYCNYSKEKFGKEITVIEPCFFQDIPKEVRDNIYEYIERFEDATDHERAYENWLTACFSAEKYYFEMLEYGCTPQEARSVLPNSLKTEVIMTANMREWRHFFRLRAAAETGAPHPQMAEVAVLLFKTCRECMPELFGDILLPEEKKQDRSEKDGTV